MPNYEADDEVRVLTREEIKAKYNVVDDEEFRDQYGLQFVHGMWQYCGAETTISSVRDHAKNRYRLSGMPYIWSDDFLASSDYTVELDRDSIDDFRKIISFGGD